MMSVALAAVYPTSPLQVFPPPLPAGHVPLRVARGVTMRLQLSTHVLGAPGAKPAWPSPKGHVQPHRSNLPRRRNPRRIVFHDADEDAAPVVEVKVEEEIEEKVEEKVEEEIKPDPYAPAPPLDSPCLQEILPGLNLVFTTPSAGELPGSSPTPYTHIVTLVPGGKPISRTHEGRTTHLHLGITEASARLTLSDAQLRTARDFLAEAQPALSPTGMQNGVRMLIGAPAGCAAGALCVLAVFLAFVTGKSVEETLLFVDQDEEVRSAWRGEVCEDEMARVEAIARAWSWLSGVVRPEMRQ